jgi:hypothetical protein
VNECSGQVVEAVEEGAAPQDVLPGPVPGEGNKEQRGSALSLEMLFREAEIIAQNLKESGTRR